MDVEQVSRDHVVPAAFGGGRTVSACKRCNDTLGHGVEARLLSRKSWFTALSQAQGWTAGNLWGVLDDGRQATSHLGYGTHRARQPRVIVESEDDSHVRLAITDPPEDEDAFFASLITRYGGSVSDTVTTRERVPRGGFSLKMVLQVQDLRRMTAKVGLCAGAVRWGDEFLLSELGEWLRVVLDVRSEWPACSREFKRSESHAGGDWPLTEQEMRQNVGQLNALLSPILDRASRGLPVMGHVPRPPYLIMFAQAERGSATIVACVMLGYVFPVLGVPHALPPGARAPVVIVEPPRGGILLQSEHPKPDLPLAERGDPMTTPTEARDAPPG